MDVKRDIKEVQKDHAAFKVDVTRELSALNTYLRNGLTHRLNAVTRFIAGVGVILVGAIVLNVVQHFAGGG